MILVRSPINISLRSAFSLCCHLQNELLSYLEKKSLNIRYDLGSKTVGTALDGVNLSGQRLLKFFLLNILSKKRYLAVVIIITTIKIIAIKARKDCSVINEKE